MFAGVGVKVWQLEQSNKMIKWKGNSVKRVVGDFDFHGALAPLNIVHSNMKKSGGVWSIIISYTGDAKQLAFMYPIRRKSDSIQCFKLFLTETERVTWRFLVWFRTENRQEYISNRFKRGIQQGTQLPHSLELNGVAERLNSTIGNKVWSALLA